MPRYTNQSHSFSKTIFHTDKDQDMEVEFSFRVADGGFSHEFGYEEQPEVEDLEPVFCDGTPYKELSADLKKWLDDVTEKIEDQEIFDSF